MIRLKQMFEISGKPAYVLGVNYQSAEFGHITDLWEDDEALAAVADRDFELMKHMGIVAIRIQSAVFHKRKSFDNILKYARKYGIYVMPNLSLGDLMKGTEGRWFKSQGGDIVQIQTEGEAGSRGQPAPSFVNERPDPFDENAIANAKEYLGGLLSHYRDEEMILAWDIANEPTYALYGMSSAKYDQYCGKDGRTAREVTGRWAEEICRAAREADPNHPITVGTDHSIVLMDVGFDIVPFSRANDLMTTHHYSRATSGYTLLDEVCSLRDSYMPAFITAFSRVTGRPFASGECGNNSYVMSEESQGLHYRMMLYSGMVNGAIGAFPWCFHTYDWNVPRIHEGYDGAPAESEFGIVRPDHTLKPAAEELVSFGRLVRRIDFSKYTLVPPDTAVLLPESYYNFLYEHRASLFNAFVLAKQAHLNVAILRSDSCSFEGYKLLIVPTTHLIVREMDRLRAFVRAGGSLVISATEALSGRISYLRDVVGLATTDYDLLPAKLDVTFERDFGKLKRGDHLRYRSDTLGWYVSHEKPENERQYYTVVEPTTAKVLARDPSGRPAILYHQFGRGHVVCFTFGAEYCLGHMPGVYKEDVTYKVYEGLADLSGLLRQVDCDSPAVELGVFEAVGKDRTTAGRAVNEGRLEADRLVLVINHGREPVTTKLCLAHKASRVTEFQSGATLAADVLDLPIGLPASGVTVLRTS